MTSLRRFAVAALLLASTAHPAFAQEDPYGDKLLGDWGGLRGTLAEKGVEVTLEYKGDFWHAASGGIKQGNNYLDNLDLIFALDGKKLFGLEGNRSLVQFLNNNGGKPNARQVGSLQGIDNIETVKDAPKLYQLWTEQSLWIIAYRCWQVSMTSIPSSCSRICRPTSSNR